MADSTVTDYSKMKVVELRKELKTRGLPTTGDKSELVARLQSATHDEVDYALDSDEDVDSEGVLEDDAAAEISLDDSHADDTLTEDLAEQRPDRQRTLKRSASQSENKSDAEETKSKKIVIHRPVTDASEVKPDEAQSTEASAAVVKLSSEKEDPKSKLEQRAKRFGLPMTDEERKEARKIRFGQTASAATKSQSTTPSKVVATDDPNIEKLKKRAERFGQSVSKAMVDVETQEKLERRRARFGLVK